MDDECGAIGGMIGSGTKILRRKSTTVPLCPPQIPHDLTRAWTWATVVGSLWPTILAKVWHYSQGLLGLSGNHWVLDTTSRRRSDSGTIGYTRETTLSNCILCDTWVVSVDLETFLMEVFYLRKLPSTSEVPFWSARGEVDTSWLAEASLQSGQRFMPSWTRRHDGGWPSGDRLLQCRFPSGTLSCDYCKKLQHAGVPKMCTTPLQP
jgi:hypothetical protein